MKKKKVDSPLLDNLYLASPCSVKWTSMQGDDRKRLCGGCSKHVFNISDMTKSEAEEFLKNNGANQCMMFFRRDDGTILTDDCPVALRKIRDKFRVAARCAAAAFAFLLSLPTSLAQSATGDKATPAQSKANSSNPVNHPGLAGEPLALPPNKPPVVPMPGGAMIVPPELGKPALKDPHNNVATPSDSQHNHASRSDTTKPGGTPTDTSDSVNVIKMGVQHNLFISKVASEFFAKGREAASQAKPSLAEFYFEKALSEFDKQKAGDPQFRKLIQGELAKVQTQQRKQP